MPSGVKEDRNKNSFRALVPTTPGCIKKHQGKTLKGLRGWRRGILIFRGGEQVKEEVVNRVTKINGSGPPSCLCRNGLSSVEYSLSGKKTT